MTLQNDNFDLQSTHENPLEFFTIPIFQTFKFPNLKHLLQMLKNCGMVEVEFLDNFCYNRISTWSSQSWYQQLAVYPSSSRFYASASLVPWLNIVSGCFQDEISIWIGRLSKVYCPPQCRYMLHSFIYIYIYLSTYLTGSFFGEHWLIQWAWKSLWPSLQLYHFTQWRK